MKHSLKTLFNEPDKQLDYYMPSLSLYLASH